MERETEPTVLATVDEVESFVMDGNSGNGRSRGLCAYEWLNGRASLKTAERYLAFVMDMIREFAGEC